MSVLEKVEQLRKDESQRLLEATENSKEKHYEHSAQFAREISWAQEQQVILLDQLRGEGVVAIIEQILDTPIIHPLERSQNTQDLLEGENLRARAKRLKEAFDRFNQHEAAHDKHFGVEVLEPTLSEEGNWDASLKMKVRKITSFGAKYPPFGWWKHEACIFVEYNDKGQLTISGNETTYSDEIPKDEQTKIDTLELALARAIINPKQEEPDFRGLDRSYPGPLIRATS